jgi:hypothetical protein
MKVIPRGFLLEDPPNTASSLHSSSEIVGDGSANVCEVHASCSLRGELCHSLYLLGLHVNSDHLGRTVI